MESASFEIATLRSEMAVLGDATVSKACVARLCNRIVAQLIPLVLGRSWLARNAAGCNSLASSGRLHPYRIRPT